MKLRPQNYNICSVRPDQTLNSLSLIRQIVNPFLSFQKLKNMLYGRRACANILLVEPRVHNRVGLALVTRAHAHLVHVMKMERY